MRLTDDLLKMSDEFHSELVCRAFALAASGRFGLLPCEKPFHISINFDKENLEIEELTCLALTKGGSLVDIDFDTRYSSSYDNKLLLSAADGSPMLLIVFPSKENWKDAEDDVMTCSYSFALMSESACLPEDAFPLARIVDEYGWRMDDYFVPPCILLSSHYAYMQLLARFRKTLSTVDRNLVGSLHADCKVALSVFWPVVRQIMIEMDKEADVMSPMHFLSIVQKYISAFTCACVLDPLLNLGDSDELDAYTRHPYDYKDVFQRISEGLEFCDSIELKTGRFSEIVHEEPAPEVSEKIVVETPSRRRLGWMGWEI